MRFLVTEKLSPHKFKTPEGYLICTDAVLSRTGKQEYRRCELFGDACNDPDKMINVERTSDEVFSDKAMSSFENKPICIQHPDVDVNSENYNELAVGFVRDIYKGFDNGQPVMLGTLVITNKEAVDDIESGKYKELSCGYDCDISEDDLTQRNIRGNHVALCEQGRAGIARIVDSVETNYTYKNEEIKMKDTSIYTLKAALSNLSKMYTSGPGIDYVLKVLKNMGYDVSVDSIRGWNANRNVPGEQIKEYLLEINLDGKMKHALVQLYADEGVWDVKEINAYLTDSVNDEHEYSIWVKNQFGEYKVVTWPAASKEAAVKEFLEMNPRYKKIGLVIAKDSADDTNTDDAKFQNLSEQAKKLKEELGLYRQQIGSHKSKGINPYAQRQKGPQVNELNEAINMAIEYLSQGVKDKSAWNRLALKLEAWQDDPECEKIAKRAANAIKKFEAFIADDWSTAEEANYKKANRPIGDYVRKVRAKSIDDAIKEKLFTVEFEKNGITYIHKLRATSLEDAIIKVKDIYNKFEHETDKEYLKSAINEMSRYIRNWPFMTMREKRQISPEGLAALKQTLKFAQLRLAELK